MVYRPRIKFGFHAQVVPQVGLFLLSERNHYLLRGKAYCELVPLLNGERTPEELIDLLQGKVSAPEVYYALELLSQKGYIVDAGVPTTSERFAAFWELLGFEPEHVFRRLSETAVSVAAFGTVSAAPLEQELAALGIRIDSEGELQIAVTDDYQQTGLDALDQRCRELRRPWLLVKPSGIEAWIGPLFSPQARGCYACLEHRLHKHRKVEGFLKRHRGGDAPIIVSLAALPSTEKTAIATAATEIARWIISGTSAALERKVWTFDAATCEFKTHIVTGRPQCPRCGDATLVATAQNTAPELHGIRTSFNEDGGYRSLSAEQTFARLEHHISPITGIIARLHPLLQESGSRLLPTYVADHDCVYIDNDLFFLEEVQRSRSSGKGKSAIQAKVSAICESIERYSGHYQGDEAIMRARIEDLGPLAVHPNDILLFSERQYKDRDRRKRENPLFVDIPVPFDATKEIGWSPVYRIPGGERRYVPASCCYYGYSKKHGELFAFADSNGCAAGATREEAAYQGLMELIERDAVALWWYNRIRRPGVHLESFGDAYLMEIEAYYQTIHRNLWVLDVTTDLGIPAFAAVSQRTDKKEQDILFGFGAHLDPKIALLRAVTECNQMLPSVFFVSTKTPDAYKGDALALQWWKNATTESEPYVVPDKALPQKRLEDYPSLCSGNLYEDLLHCARILGQKGLDVFLLDQTRPDTDLPVVKIFVPGLRHFRPRFAPGRLYDVPVQMGCLSRPPVENELNPYPMYL